MIGVPETVFAYGVYYQTIESGDDWFEMSGRNYNAPYRYPSDSGLHNETFDMREALGTAEALVKQLAYPHDPGERYYRRVTAAYVITRVHTGHVSAVFGTPNVSRETEGDAQG